MDVLVLSFFFLFVLVFIVLAMAFRSRTLYFISGGMLLLWGYLLLINGVTETSVLGRTVAQTFVNEYNETTNTTSIASIATTENVTHVLDKNDYTNGYGTIAIILGVVFAIVPILQEASGGKITLI